MSFAVGSLVKARGREWVVLPESNETLLMLRPLGGTDDEITGILTTLESVTPAQFGLPNPNDVGDFRSCRLLRDAVRLSTRSSSGPFRSFARIAVEPRPYQLVPLLMALKLNPVRILIADDVGIGKTVEALLIARELLDRGEIDRTAVLCPPHLAEQWQKELNEKFHIEAELVLPNTTARLERFCRHGQSLFEVYPHVIVSLDFIKSERRKDEFVRACPELVIVDEAHTCAFGYEGRGKHQRHQLIARLVENQERHLILVTATPHSGKEDAFRSLLKFLNPEFSTLPEDLTGRQHESLRRQVATQFVQRRRADIRHFLQTETPFPERQEKEETYSLTPPYRNLLNRVLEYTKEMVTDKEGGDLRQRVRWWSALALLRSLASSPAAAAASLRNRNATEEADTAEELEEIGKHAVLDLLVEDQLKGIDLTPGSNISEKQAEASKHHRKSLELAREAEKLQGDSDPKLLKAVTLIKNLVAENFSTIVFCRFIHTADYLAQELRQRLPKGIEIASVTGVLPPSDREARINQLSSHNKKVLVCTDCLSEGINLQQHFDAVMHYDLSWNPTRHEQREGRVDRFNQPNSPVRVLTFYGKDNPIDGIVIDVLIQKHKKIRNSLGISVPIPSDSDAIMQAMFEGLLLRNNEKSAQMLLDGFEEYMGPKKEDLHAQWDNVSQREKRSRTMFAQESIKPDEVAAELKESRKLVGSSTDVERFTLEAFKAEGATIASNRKGFDFDLKETRRSLRDLLSSEDSFRGRFDLPVDEEVLYLQRTHPIIEGLARYVMDTCMDSINSSIAHRVGAIRTQAISRRTTLLLLRFRHDIVSKFRDRQNSQLTEECRMLAFAGSPTSAEWLDRTSAESLLLAEPQGNILPEQARQLIAQVIDSFPSLQSRIEQEAHNLAKELSEAHQRVRQASKMIGVRYDVVPQLPADVLGVYLFLPTAKQS